MSASQHAAILAKQALGSALRAVHDREAQCSQAADEPPSKHGLANARRANHCTAHAP